MQFPDSSGDQPVIVELDVEFEKVSHQLTGRGGVDDVSMLSSSEHLQALDDQELWGADRLGPVKPTRHLLADLCGEEQFQSSRSVTDDHR